MDKHRRSLVPTFLIAQLERAANGALKYAPVTRIQMVPLKGHSLGIQLQRPAIPLQLCVDKRQIRIYSNWEMDTDVTIKGPAMSLVRQLTKNQTTPADLMQNGIEIDGDQELAEQFITLLRNLDLDFEGILADFIGDLAARQLGNFARTGLEIFHQAATTFAEQTKRFIAEDQAMVVGPSEFDQFKLEVDEIRQRGDRLQARLQNIQQQLEPKP